jgi:DNA-binding XRE family transcriptional regulator
MTFIYTLSDSSGVRYIGKSDFPLERFRYHLKECKKQRTYKEKWIVKAKNGYTRAQLAKEYNVSRTAITFIVNGVRWKKA